MSDQPEEGEDGAAAPAHRGVQGDDPHVGLRPRAAAQDRHVFRPHVLGLQLRVGRWRDVGVRWGSRGWRGSAPRVIFPGERNRISRLSF